MAPEAASRSARLARSRSLRIAVLLVLAIAAYRPVFDGGFVWDDDEHLVKNIVLQENGLYRAWFTTESVVYYPMVWTSYWVEHQIWGLDPSGYHVVNVVLHALNALLVWGVLARLRVPGAWFAGLVFAIHPVNVETAAWITQRKNTLSFLFYGLSLLLFLRSEETTRHRTVLYRSAVASFLLSMLGKSAGAPLPVVLLLIAWWRRGRVERRDLANSIPFFAVAVLMSLVEIAFQYGNALGMESVRQDSFLTRLVGSGWVVWFYLSKALLPLDLSFVYPRWEIDPASLAAWLPGLVLLAVFVACWRARHGAARSTLVALSYFVLLLAPVLGILEFYYLKYSFVGDHYQYFAIAAPIAWAVGGAFTLAKRLSPPARRAAAVLPAVLAAALFALTWERSGHFADREALWRHTLTKNPDALLARFNLAALLQAEGRLDEAAAEYREALRIDPSEKGTYNNLGLVLCGQGDCEAALDEFREALRIDPDYVEGHNNLGSALQRLGRNEEAAQHYRAAAAGDPDNAVPQMNLASALANLGAVEDSAAALRRAAELAPGDPEPRVRLGRLLRKHGDMDGADRALRAALERAPGNAAAHRELGLLREAEGRNREAARHFKLALRTRPRWGAARQDLRRVQGSLAGPHSPAP